MFKRNTLSLLIFFMMNTIFIHAQTDIQKVQYLDFESYIEHQHASLVGNTIEAYHYNGTFGLRYQKIMGEEEDLFIEYSSDKKVKNIYVRENNASKLNISIYPSGNLNRYTEYFSKNKKQKEHSIYWDNTDNQTKGKKFCQPDCTSAAFCIDGYFGSFDCNKTHIHRKTNTKIAENNIFKTAYIDKKTFIQQYKQKDKLGTYKAYRKDGTLATSLTKVSLNNHNELNLLYKKKGNFRGFISFLNGHPNREITFYDSGKLKEYKLYGDNTSIREVKLYYNTDSNYLKQVKIYQNTGMKYGIENSYCKNGKVKESKHFNNGKIIKHSLFVCNE